MAASNVELVQEQALPVVSGANEIGHLRVLTPLGASRRATAATAAVALMRQPIDLTGGRPQHVDSSVAKKLASWVTPEEFGAVGDGSADDTAAWQKALDSGSLEIIAAGAYRTTAPLLFPVTAGVSVVLVDGGCLLPAHDDDTIRLRGERQGFHGLIDGGGQPAAALTPGSAIVVGYGLESINGAGSGCSIAGSVVQNIHGNGVLWRQGSLLDLSNVLIRWCSGDGVRADGSADDNNHGRFAGGHIVGCGRGVVILKNGLGAGPVHANDSRHHVFDNWKCFGCGMNYYIETYGNYGSIFSENGLAPDKLTSHSSGNRLIFLSTPSALAAAVGADEGAGNTFEGTDSYDRWSMVRAFAHRLTISAALEGSLALVQTAAKTFKVLGGGTSDHLTITDDPGTAASITRHLSRMSLGLPTHVKDRWFRQGGTINVSELATGGVAYVAVSCPGSGLQPGQNWALSWTVNHATNKSFPEGIVIEEVYVSAAEEVGFRIYARAGGPHTFSRAVMIQGERAV